VITELTGHLDDAVAASRRLHQAMDAAQNTLTWAAAAGE
jgi:hypothetical protein